MGLLNLFVDSKSELEKKLKNMDEDDGSEEPSKKENKKEIKR